MNSSSRNRFLRSLAILVSAGGALGFTAGCATTNVQATVRGEGTPRSEAMPAHRTSVGKSAKRKAGPTTGRVITRADMQRQTSTNHFGDEVYAEVDSAWLRDFHRDFLKELHRLGIVRWNERFDCNRFTELFVGLAQARFYRESFHSDTPARALAMGSYWYVRDDGRGTHALVQVLTERGRIFVDPQSGEEVTLTRRETARAYFQFF